jgi:outer membrane lipoprotein carrier protein
MTTLSSCAVPRVPAVGRIASLLACVVSIATLLAFPGVAAAAALEQLRGFVTDTRSARGDFTQELVRANGRAGETTRGTFAFSRPGKFRWEVQRPYEQLIVADGERLHFYDVDLRQVTVRRLGDALAATPAALLFGGGADLDASFTLSEMGERDGVAWLDALPKSRDAGFERIQLGFRGGVPVAMEVRDAFGQVTKFTFRDVQVNKPIEPGLFRFTPPKGVDVVQ